MRGDSRLQSVESRSGLSAILTFQSSSETCNGSAPFQPMKPLRLSGSDLSKLSLPRASDSDESKRSCNLSFSAILICAAVIPTEASMESAIDTNRMPRQWVSSTELTTMSGIESGSCAVSSSLGATMFQLAIESLSATALTFSASSITSLSEMHPVEIAGKLMPRRKRLNDRRVSASAGRMARCSSGMLSNAEEVMFTPSISIVA